MKRLLAPSVMVAVAALVSGCGHSSKPAAIAGPKVAPLTASAPPEHLLGLDVHLEDMSQQVKGVTLTYVNATALYSLRRNDVVQGTLQVSRFEPKAPYTQESFRRSFLTQLSGTAPQAYRLGDQTVYQTSGLRQRLAVWFKGDKVFVLSTREEFDHPRDLIRAALALPES